jgi:large subunit ribosomal protein L32e
MKNKKFLRRDWHKYLRLGMKRRKKQKWRKPKGRDNKMRERRRGYSTSPHIGLKRNDAYKKDTILLNNFNDLKIAKAGSEVVLGSTIGRKKRFEIAREAQKKGIKILNLNVKKFLKSFEEKKEENKKTDKEKEKKAEKIKEEKTK